MKFYSSNKFDFCYYGQVNSILAKIECSFEIIIEPTEIM